MGEEQKEDEEKTNKDEISLFADHLAECKLQRVFTDRYVAQMCDKRNSLIPCTLILQEDQ